VTWTDGNKVEQLHLRYLNPVERIADRGAQSFDLPLPSSAKEATIILTTRCGPNDVMDWSCWAMPEFK